MVQSFGPYSVNVTVPPAAAPPVPVRLMTGLAGWVARPLRLALSETVLARKMEADAAFGNPPRHDAVLPDGSAPGPREVFLV